MVTLDVTTCLLRKTYMYLPDCQEWVQMGLVVVQVVVEMAEKEIPKPVVGTFVGQAEKT